jgi:hypothetical protein
MTAYTIPPDHPAQIAVRRRGHAIEISEVFLSVVTESAVALNRIATSGLSRCFCKQRASAGHALSSKGGE